MTSPRESNWREEDVPIWTRNVIPRFGISPSLHLPSRATVSTKNRLADPSQIGNKIQIDHRGRTRLSFLLRWTVIFLLLLVTTIPFFYLKFVGDHNAADHFRNRRHHSSSSLTAWETKFIKQPNMGGAFFFHKKILSDRSINSTSDLPHSSMPNFFHDRKFLLHGARLTVSLDPANQDVHVDLFGFPGNFFILDNFWPNRPRCIGKLATDINRTLLTFDQVATDLQFFCQLNMVPGHESNNIDPKIIPMMVVPLHSSDGNERRTSFIWRCNVTDYINKTMLIQEARDVAKKNIKSWVSVNFSMQNKTEGTNITVITTQDIAMDTGVGGKGGPTIRGGASSYFLQPTVPVGLCVPTLRDKVLLYLEEFILHHLNVGFGSIVIGLRLDDDQEDPNLLRRAQEILKPYIDAGVVSLSLYGVPNLLDCDEDIHKMQFFQTCLYHHKGLTKYSATWDIDEFWTPPKTLQILQEESTNIIHENIHMNSTHDNHDTNTLDENNKNVIIHASNWSTFSVFTQNDLIWQKSPYSQSISIFDVIKAVEQRYIKEGCKEAKFCYFRFPSNEVFLRYDPSIGKFIQNRTNRIGKDFEFRWTQFVGHGWQKSIGNTQYAYMSGFHGFGSCLFDKSTYGTIMTNLSYASYKEMYLPIPLQQECSPRLHHPELYGQMHHFASLFFDYQRWDDTRIGNGSKTWPVDEYVSTYSETVGYQLDRRSRPIG